MKDEELNFIKQKARITIVISVDTDSSDAVSVHYIGHAAQPRCFRGTWFIHYKEDLTSQKNVWMDGEMFKEWIIWS